MRAKLLMSGVAVLPLVWGCNNANSQPESTNPSPAPVVEAASPASPATNHLTAGAEVPMGQVVSTNFAPPATVKLSPAAAEIAKMAHSGVAASVMVSYVANSVNTYNLAADEIVYLNDLGVHPDVVSAMIQHDQQIREASLNGAMAASPATPAPGTSVWNAGNVTDSSNVWQETVATPAADAPVQTTVPPPPEEERPAEVTVNYFYDSLSPYGTWIDIDGYGRCWRPTVVATYPGWRPYVHGGRWLWTDCGWYWYSDYSWGWGPFHYGRWFSHPSWGWCWMPGTVWGPSWVSWRYTDGYCGWAPLPPAAYYAPGFGFSYYGSSCGVGFSFGLTWDYFTFVSYNNFCGRYYDRHCARPHEAKRIYNESTVVNNVIVGDNNTIINQGIGIDRVSAATPNEIPRANVRAQGGGVPKLEGRRELLAADGSSVTVARHEVPGSRRPARAGAAPDALAAAAGAPLGPASTASVTDAATSTPRREMIRTSVGTSPMRQGSPTATPGNPRSEPAEVAATAKRAEALGSSASATERVRPARNNHQPGALIIREGKSSATPARENVQPTVQPTPSVAGTSRATPWLNHSTPKAASTARPGDPSGSSLVQSDRAAVTAAGRPARTGGQLIIRSQPDKSPAAVSTPQPVTPRIGEAPNATAARSPSSAWTRSTRVESTPAPVTQSGNNNITTIGRSHASSVPRMSSPVRPSFTPAPVQRIERSAPARPFTPPAQPQPPRSSPPAFRSSPAPAQMMPRVAQPAPSMQPAPVPAPAQSAAPVQRSAPAPSGGRPGWNSGQSSRPGR